MNVSLPPALKRFVDDQVASGRYADAGDVVRHAVRQMEGRVQAFSPMAVETDVLGLAFIVMMEAARSAQEDLKSIMATVKAINAAKQALRELLRQVSRDLAENERLGRDEGKLDFSRGLGVERAYHRARVPRLDPDCPGGVCFEEADLYPGRVNSVTDLRLIVGVISDKVDSLSEMGEMESLRMQMAMDRLSKMMTTLSNILKKLGDSSQSIADNLK